MGADGWYRSETLAPELRADDVGVWFPDAATGEVYLPDGLRAEVERERADAVCAEVERLLAALRERDASG